MSMHDFWNPWHGCIKKSEGCQNCYVYAMDHRYGSNGRNIYRVKGNFDYPLQRHRDGSFKVKSGEMLRVCMTSDFFIEEADVWREEAWSIIRKRSDVAFLLLTKRPERVSHCLPEDWGKGWENVFFNVTAENQVRANERIPILLDLPFVHKGLIVAPFIGKISIEHYLKEGKIEQVVAGGENYIGARPLDFDWVRSLYDQCVDYNVRFCFMDVGTKFIKDGKLYTFSNKRQRYIMAHKSGLQFEGKPIKFNLNGYQTSLLDESQLYKKEWSEACETCGARLICNGCRKCSICACLRQDQRLDL